MKHNFPKQSAYWLLKKNYSAASQQGQEQNTSMSHPAGPAYSVLSFVLSRGTGASWALAVEKPAQSPGLGQGLDPRARFLPEDWRWPFLPLDISVM